MPLARHTDGLSHADLVRAAEAAAKQTVLAEEETITADALETALRERHPSDDS